MARTSAVSTLSPLAFSTGVPIKFEDVRAVINQLNWSGANRPINHACLNTGDDGDLVVLGPLKIIWSATAGVFRQRLRHRARISRDAPSVSVRYRVNVDAAGTTVRVRVTIGGAAAVTNSHTSAGNGTNTTVTSNVSSTGSGWQTITVELERQAGAANASLNFYTADDDVITSLLAPAE